MTYQEQAKQLALNAQVIAAANKAACDKIDRFAEKIRTGSKTARTSKMAPATIHDVAANNPALCAYLQRIQRRYCK